jgi:hypothetical protein
VVESPPRACRRPRGGEQHSSLATDPDLLVAGGFEQRLQRAGGEEAQMVRAGLEVTLERPPAEPKPQS